MEIVTAKQLLDDEQSALLIFTRGNHFIIKPDGSGSTGNWRIKSTVYSEKVIVYCRQANSNVVYTADFADLVNSSEPGRKIILLRNICAAGVTSSNWRQFGGRSQSPVQFIACNAE